MGLGDWSHAGERDTGRSKRLAGAYVTATIVVGVTLAIGVVFGDQIKKQVFEEEIEVKLAPPEPVKPAPPPPAPPPPPPPATKVASLGPAPLGNKQDAPPTEIPKGSPDEGDPNAPTAEGPAGDPNGVVGGTGHGGGELAPPTPSPAPAPAPPPPPMQIAEVSTPPVPLSKTMPAYPEDARKQGIEAVVVVRFVVDEAGRVAEPRIVKGHPLFDELVLSAVRTWTFEPATLDGRAVRIVRMVKMPFRLKHS